MVLLSRNPAKYVEGPAAVVEGAGSVRRACGTRGMAGVGRLRRTRGA